MRCFIRLSATEYAHATQDLAAAWGHGVWTEYSHVVWDIIHDDGHGSEFEG